MEKYVMISYNQESATPLARKVNELLKQNNIKTWIDFEKIKCGNIFKAIAEATENAYVVLVFITKEYCQKQICLDECGNAVYLKKPIIPIRVTSDCDPTKTTGEFGFNVRRLLYFDFSDSSKLEKNFGSLLTAINYYKSQDNDLNNNNASVDDTSKNQNVQNIEITRKVLVNRPELITLCGSKENKYQEVKEMIEQYNANVNYKDLQTGTTALIKASVWGHYQIVELLLKNGAIVNATDNDGHTALLLVLDKQSTDIAKLLIENGANMNVKNKYGKTPLIIATCYRRVEMVKLLIEKGADLNAQVSGENADRQRRGYTALMMASSEGSEVLAQLLIANKVDVNIKANNGETALIEASMGGFFNLAKILIEYGADVNADSKDGSAIIYASQYGHTDVVKLLIENGANVNDTIKDGICKSDSALMRAILYDQFQVVKLLIQKGVDVNYKDKSNLTALMIASQKGNLNIVKLLADAGAEIIAANSKDWISSMKIKPEIKEYLTSKLK